LEWIVVLYVMIDGLTWYWFS